MSLFKRPYQRTLGTSSLIWLSKSSSLWSKTRSQRQVIWKLKCERQVSTSASTCPTRVPLDPKSWSTKQLKSCRKLLSLLRLIQVAHQMLPHLHRQALVAHTWSHRVCSWWTSFSNRRNLWTPWIVLYLPSIVMESTMHWDTPILRFANKESRCSKYSSCNLEKSCSPNLFSKNLRWFRNWPMNRSKKPPRANMERKIQLQWHPLLSVPVRNRKLN